MDNDTDDPEERRKKLETQQAASDLGAAIGLVVGAAMTTQKHSQEEPAEEIHQPKMEGM